MKRINKIETNNVKKIVFALVFMLILISISAQDNNSGAAYTRMGIGARSLAMGDASTAITTDVTSAYWNPAGLNGIRNIEFVSTYDYKMGYDRTYKNASFAIKREMGIFAINWINATVGEIDGYDDNDNPTGIFDNDEHNIGLSYANSYNRFQYGFTLKYFSSIIQDELESGYGFDLGLKYDINQYFVTGLFIRDLYSTLADDEIPYQISFGLAAYPFLGITLSSDVKMEKSESPTYHFGAEYWTSIGQDNEVNSKLTVTSIKERNTWQEVLSEAKTGLRLGFDDGKFSVGTGLRLRNFQVDYAYKLNNHEIFNDQHVISLILRF